MSTLFIWAYPWFTVHGIQKRRSWAICRERALHEVERCTKKKINCRRDAQVIGFCLMMFIILIPRTLQVGHKWPQAMHSIYLTFGKLFFVIGVSMMVTPSLLGVKNDLVFFLMDTKFFHFIGKISFWTYLIHYNLIVIVLFSQKVDFYYEAINILPVYFPIVIMSLGCGFIGTLLVEMPFAHL